MQKKILVITGSPRANGNTNSLCKAFMTGAIAAGHEVEVFDAVTCKMDGCHADKSCFTKGFCGLKDDGVKLYELMSWADVLVISTPVYWLNVTSQMKTVLDRLYPYAGPKARENCSVKESFLISAAGNPDLAVFDGVKATYAHVNGLLKFNSVGELLVPGVAGPDDVNGKSEYIKMAVEAGYHI